MPEIVARSTGEQVRGIAYFFAPVLFFAAVVAIAGITSVEQVVSEGGLVERFQSACLAFATVWLMYCARQFVPQRGVLSVAAALGALGLFRELNNSPWYRDLFRFSEASTIFGAFVLCTVILWHRQGLIQQAREAIRAPSFFYLAVGSIMVVGWAQVLAQRSLLEHRLYDRAVEECLEAAGYIIITCGVLERYVELRSAALRKRETATAAEAFNARKPHRAANPGLLASNH